MAMLVVGYSALLTAEGEGLDNDQTAAIVSLSSTVETIWSHITLDRRQGPVLNGSRLGYFNYGTLNIVTAACEERGFFLGYSQDINYHVTVCIAS
jgi:hypothetical protein